MGVPEVRRAGGAPTALCAWCQLPASYIWVNRHPGSVEGAEMEAETLTCPRCEDLLDTGRPVELIHRAIDSLIHDLAGVPDMHDWTERAWATTSARLAVWLDRREIRRALSWEILLACARCGCDTWHSEDRATSKDRCSVCGAVYRPPVP
jgi:hypothetical protein